MSLIQRIEQDLITSLRERQQEKTAVLRMLKSSFKNYSIAKKVPESDLTDEQIVAILRQELKKRIEAAEAYVAGNRPELEAKEKNEAEIVTAYLPPSLSSDEIKTIIESVIEEAKLSPPYQFGTIMGMVVKKIAGRADGSAVKDTLQAYLAQKT